MTVNEREQRILGAAIGMWLLVAAVTWLAYCHWHGFDPSLCWSYGGCNEYRA